MSFRFLLRIQNDSDLTFIVTLPNFKSLKLGRVFVWIAPSGRFRCAEYVSDEEACPWGL